LRGEGSATETGLLCLHRPGGSPRVLFPFTSPPALSIALFIPHRLEHPDEDGQLLVWPESSKILGRTLIWITVMIVVVLTQAFGGFGRT